MKNNELQMHDEATAQLELGFSGNACLHRPLRRSSRGQRAAWWFQRMRQVVECAVEWTPTPPPRPEQTWLPETHRECSV